MENKKALQYDIRLKHISEISQAITEIGLHEQTVRIEAACKYHPQL